MQRVEPKVYLLAQTRMNHATAREWLNDMGAPDFEYDKDEPDGANLVMLAGKRCYKSFNVDLNPNLTRVRTDMVKFIDNILKTGHGSVLEHVSFTFALENITRVLTAELNRHRAGAAISEGSLRYIRFQEEGINYWLPELFHDKPGDSKDMKVRKEMTRGVYDRVFEQVENGYKLLCSLWEEELASKSFGLKKKLTSAFRRIVPMGCATGGVWTYNIRALRHIFTMRCAAAAEEEIIKVACMMLKLMQRSEPQCFGDFEFNEKKAQWEPKYRKV